jgi:PRTRC genetic system protein F
MEFYVPGENSLSVPLAIALLEGDVANDAFFQRPNRTLIEVLGELDEREFCIAALSAWWSSLTQQYPLKHFHWNLHVQQEMNQFADERVEDDSSDTAWFCLTRSQNSDIPRVALARRMQELEARLEGFGQTVLAVLCDATSYLPESFTPWRALDYAEWLHWSESSSDEELISLQQEQDGCTREEAEASVLTRKEFYGDTPHWFMQPTRVRSRDEIVRAARDEFTKSVIAACDEIARFVSSPGFTLESWNIGAHNTQIDSVDGFAVIRWHANDQIGRVIDDALEMAGNSGEYCEFLDAIRIRLSGEGIAAYLSRMEQIQQLAMHTERLLFLLGDPL